MKVLCKKQSGDDWEYTLSNGSKVTREEWNRKTLEYIQKHDDGAMFESIRTIAKNTIWCEKDTVMDFALQLYGEQIKLEFSNCENRVPAFNLAIVQDKELGCEQLKFV